MNRKIIFKLIIIAVILGLYINCTGYPAAVDHFGNITPTIQDPDALPKGPDAPDTVVLDYQNNSFELIPIVNLDGSITLFTYKNVAVRIMPARDGRTRGPLDRTAYEFEALIPQWLEILEANPNDYNACIMLAGLYIDRNREGDAELALFYSDRALAISRDNPQALYTRGLAYSEKGESEKAIQDLSNVLKINIQSMKGVYYVMGKIYYKEGNIENALEAFEKVRAIDPEFVDIQEILDELYKIKK